MLDYVLILEDDPARVKRFTQVLQEIEPQPHVVIWRSARQMLREIAEVIPHASLISLDHDLIPADDGEDPGDGLEVARYLAEHNVHCPVIIHTSNADRARMMQGELQLAGIEPRMVAPLGADWIENYWGRMVRSQLASSALSARGSGT